jgi:hypothetical protein
MNLRSLSPGCQKIKLSSRNRGCGNVKRGLAFQGFVGRVGNGSIVFRAFHKPAFP